MSIRDEEGLPEERQIPFSPLRMLTAGSNEERRRILTTIQAQQTARASELEAFACDSAPASTRVDKEEFQCRQYALMPRSVA